jgi:hypothetical protein
MLLRAGELVGRVRGEKMTGEMMKSSESGSSHSSWIAI